MQLTISVTQQDIDLGTRKANWACPITLAARRAFLPVMGEVSVSVSPFDLRAASRGDFDLATFHTLPPIAQEFVRNYDVHGPSVVAPFDFVLTVDAL